MQGSGKNESIDTGFRNYYYTSLSAIERTTNETIEIMKRRRNLTIILLCLTAVVTMLIDLMTPATELIRFRNSLLANVGEPADFNWVPGAVPAEFNYETLLPPPVLANVSEEIRASSALAVPLMTEIVAHLRSQPKRSGPIKSTTVEAYRLITETGRGYCADYTQVFNGLAHSVKLPVREWGMSFDRFGGDGHAFNEVYDETNKQWVFVDPMNGFYVTDSTSGRPLSVLEFRDRLIEDGGFASINFVRIGENFLFDSDREAFEYFQNGAAQFYQWFGNDVFSYDRHPVVRFLGPISRSMEQLAAIMLGIHPRIRIFPTDTNQSEIAALLRLRFQFLGLVLAAFLLGVLGFVQAILWYRESRDRPEPSHPDKAVQ